MKDKLMELLNEMTNARNEVNSKIKQQTLNKTIKGLYIISSCFEYAIEMTKYFEKISGGGRYALHETICKMQFCVENGKCFLNINCTQYWKSYTNSVFELYEIERIAEDKEHSDLHFIARRLVDEEYTLEKFQEEVNNVLIKLMTYYHKKTEQLKKNLGK